MRISNNTVAGANLNRPAINQTLFGQNNHAASVDKFVKTASAKPQFTGQAISSYFKGETNLMKWAEKGDVLKLKNALEEDEAELKTIDRKDIYGQTALMKAAENNARCARLLVKWGANIDLADNDGRTALDRIQSEQLRAELTHISELGFLERMKLNV